MSYEPGDPRDDCHYGDGDAVGSALIVCFLIMLLVVAVTYWCS